MAGRTFMPTSEFQDLIAVQGRISFCVMHLSESPVRVTLLKTDSNVSRKPDINWPPTDGPWPCCVSSGFDRLKGFDHPDNGHNCGLAQCPTSPIHCTCSLDLGTLASHRTVVRVGHTIRGQIYLSKEIAPEGSITPFVVMTCGTHVESQDFRSCVTPGHWNPCLQSAISK